MTSVDYARVVADMAATEGQSTRVQGTKHFAAAATTHGATSWLMDTGASIHLIGAAYIKHLKKHIKQAAEPLSLLGADGPIETRDEIQLYLQSLDRTLDAYILPNSQPAISVGRLVIDMGYGFSCRHSAHTQRTRISTYHQ